MIEGSQTVECTWLLPVAEKASNLQAGNQRRGRVRSLRAICGPHEAGTERTIVAGESYTIPAGHDAWVDGNQPPIPLPKGESAMATLDELIKIEGVVAAGEFARDGQLIAYKAKMDMPLEMAEMSAQFCATVSMMFNTLAGAYSKLTAMKWVPQQGWAYSGGDMTVAIGGNKGVFIKREKANFNELFAVLVGPSQGTE
jgi:roadblock/LC7 domain-containing protein